MQAVEAEVTGQVGPETYMSLYDTEPDRPGSGRPYPEVLQEPPDMPLFGTSLDPPGTEGPSPGGAALHPLPSSLLDVLVLDVLLQISGLLVFYFGATDWV